MTLVAARITPPELPPVCLRERLFAWLDARADRSVLWIEGPAGAGKTTLIASYLEARKRTAVWYTLDERDADPASFFETFAAALRRVSPAAAAALPQWAPEYQSHLSRFARRACDRFFARLVPPAVVVLDDVHAVPAASPWQVILRDGLAHPPPGVTVIAASRSGTPPSLARRRAERAVAELPPKALLLTEDEAANVLRLLNASHGTPERSSDFAHTVCAMAGGWAAATVLLGEAALVRGSDALDPASVGAELFDYVASEVLAGLEAPTRDVLLAVALMPSFTAEQARDLSGVDDIPRRLSELSRPGVLVRRHGGPDGPYVLHPLLRSFLASRAARHEGAAAHRATTVAVLEASGDIDAALAVTLEGGDTGAAARLVRDHGPTLLHANWHETLARWLSLLPPALVASDGELLLLQGRVRIHSDPPAAALALKVALDHFVAAGDARGAFRAWGEWSDAVAFAIADTSQLDEALTLLAELSARFGPPPEDLTGAIATGSFVAAYYRAPSHPEIATWARVASDHLAPTEDLDGAARRAALLALFYVITGDPQQAAVVLGRIGVAGRLTPMVQGGFCFAQAVLAVAVGELDRAVGICDAACASATESGILCWVTLLQSARGMAALLRGDLALANDALDAAHAHRQDAPRFHGMMMDLVACWRELVAGRPLRARAALDRWRVTNATEAFELNRPLLAAAESWLAALTDDLEGAARWADRAVETARQLNARWHELGARLAVAATTLRRQGGPTSEVALRVALDPVRRRGLTTSLLWHPGLVADVLVEAMSCDVEPAWAAALATRLRLRPTVPPRHLLAWPWRVRIHTLGGVRIEVDGRPVTFGRKPPRRPLQLLTVLIALGGERVPSWRLCDAQWDELDGDAALHALRTTLYRLRQLLAPVEALVNEQQTLGLDPTLVWVDVLALDALRARLAAGDDQRRVRRWLDALGDGEFAAGTALTPVELAARRGFAARLATLRQATRA